MDPQPLINLLEKLPLSSEQKQLCLQTLKQTEDKPQAIKAVIKYLISLARLNQMEADRLKLDVHFYDQILEILGQPQPSI